MAEKGSEERRRLVPCGEDGCVRLQLLAQEHEMELRNLSTQKTQELKHISEAITGIRDDIKDLKRLHTKVSVLYERLPGKTSSLAIGGGAGGIGAGLVMGLAELLKVLL